MTRRELLKRCGMGLGLLGLSSLLQREGLLARAGPLGERGLSPLAPEAPHITPRAKRVIWLFINGGPSHMDTWEYKPALEKYHGKELEGFDKFTGFFSREVGAIMQSPSSFPRVESRGKWCRKYFRTWGNMWIKWHSFTPFTPNPTTMPRPC